MDKIQDLKDLFIEQARNLYSAEKQKLEAFPKFRALVSSQEAKETILNHVDETRIQIKRLDFVFAQLGVMTRGTRNPAMECLLAESYKELEKIDSQEVLNIAVIDCIQQINHYTIGGYGNIATYAEQLGYDQVCDMLLTTLEEEVARNQNLTGLEKAEFFTVNGNGKKQYDRPFPKEWLSFPISFSPNRKNAMSGSRL